MMNALSVVACFILSFSSVAPVQNAEQEGMGGHTMMGLGADWHLLQIKGAKLSKASDVQLYGMDRYTRKSGSMSATEGILSVKIIRLGYDISGFARKGERLWQAEVYEFVPALNLRAILWIHPDTEQVYFVAGPWDSPPKLSQKDPSRPRPVTWAAYEVSDHLWAGLVSEPVARFSQIGDKSVPIEELPRVYHVSCSINKSIPWPRLWQRVYDPNVMAGDERLYNFTFGPVDEHRFCLAFMQGVSVYFYVLDSRTNVPDIEDTLSYEDYQAMPHRPQDVKDDPARIDLQKILDRAYHIEACKPEEITIDGISACGDRRVLHLTLRHKAKLTLLCPLDRAESDCIVCTYP